MPRNTVRQADMSLRHRKIRLIIEALIAEDAMPADLTTLRNLILARNGGRSADRYKLFEIVMGSSWVNKQSYFDKYPLLRGGPPSRARRGHPETPAATTAEPARNSTPAATMVPPWQQAVNRGTAMGCHEFKVNTQTNEVHAVLRAP